MNVCVSKKCAIFLFISFKSKGNEQKKNAHERKE